MQWKGPYIVREGCGLYDSKFDVKEKLKTFHINMLQNYIERKHEETRVLTKVNLAVIEEESDDFMPHADENLIFPSVQASESITDLSENLSVEQGQVRSLLYEYQDVFTDVRVWVIAVLFSTGYTVVGLKK